MIKKEELKNKFAEQFELDRKTYRFNLIQTLILLVGLSLMIIGATIGLCFLWNPVLVIILGLLCYVCMCALPIIARLNKFDSTFKKQLLPKLVDFILHDEQYKFEHEGVIHEDIFRQSNLFNNDFNFYEGEDFFSLLMCNDRKNRATLFAGSDLRVKNVKIDEDGNKKYKTIFKGMFCQIKFADYFKCKLEINTKNNLKLEKMNLEGVDFREKYKAYTSDQIEARLILTTTFMDKLIQIEKHAKCKIQLAFCDDSLFLIFEKNFLKVFLKGKALDFRDIEQVYDDIRLIKELTQIIIKNEKIFLI